MTQNHPENHPNGYTSRQLAFSDARIAVAKLCALDRSPAYRAAVTEVLRAIDDAAPPDPETSDSTPADKAMWDVAVGEVGTVKVPPYGFPVIVLARPAELAILFRAVARKFGRSAQGPAGLEPRDRERLLYAGRVLRAIADQGRDAPVGPLCTEAAIAVKSIRYALGITEENSTKMGLAPNPENPSAANTALGELMAGWRDAGIAWAACASMHGAFARGKDPLFAKRQLEFSQRAQVAKSKCNVIAGPVLADVDI